MKIFISIILLAIIFPSLSPALIFKQSSGELEIGISPNAEAVYTILQLTKFSGTLRKYAPDPDAAAIFAAYKDHPAVAELDSEGALNWKKGLSFDAVTDYTLHFSDMPEGKRLYDYNDSFLDRVLRDMPKEEKIKYLDAYWEKVRDFYLKSGFQSYLEQHEPVYKVYVSSVSANLPAFDVIKAHEEYHAKRGLKFHIVPLPLGLPTGDSYGGRAGDNIFNFMGRRLYSAANVKELALHEFGHAFCNPVAEKHSELTKKHEHLFKGIKKEMGLMHYGEWLTVMREVLVRAVHARIILKTEGPEAAGELLKSDKEAKFVFTEDFYNLLEEYEKDRSRYPTLYEFYPRLAEALNNWELGEVAETEPAGFKVWPYDRGPFLNPVTSDSAAYAAGFRLNDIITGVDGEKVSAEFMRSLRAGKTYAVTVLRAGGKTETIPFTLKHIKVQRPVRKAPALPAK
jgi:hypothetical protein